jgi:hypothetical protein
MSEVSVRIVGSKLVVEIDIDEGRGAGVHQDTGPGDGHKAAGSSWGREAWSQARPETGVQASTHCSGDR